MRTSLVFWGQGDREPGWLVRCLSEFAFRGVNLSKIESRPLRSTIGHYRFFVDCDDGLGSPPRPRGASPGCATHCTDVRVLGSYPRERPSRLTRGLMADLLTPPDPLGSVPLTDPRHGPGDSPAASRGANGRVLVLNATYEPVNVCTVRRAVVLLLKEKAEVIERAAWELHSETTTLARPMVIRLVTFVKVPRDTHRRKITRRAVFARDGWQCQYCGSRANLTVDHVIPRSKGGTSTWENIVASCAPCNRRKGDSLPATGGDASQAPAARPAPADLHPRRRADHPGAVAAVAA